MAFCKDCAFYAPVESGMAELYDIPLAGGFCQKWQDSPITEESSGFSLEWYAHDDSGMEMDLHVGPLFGCNQWRQSPM